MANQPDHRSGGWLMAFVLGMVFGSQLHTHRHRPKSVAPNYPLRDLDARQAMTVAKVAHIVGIVAIAVFFAFYVYSLWQL